MTQPEPVPVEDSAVPELLITAAIAAFAVVVLNELTEWLGKVKRVIFRPNGSIDRQALVNLDADWAARVDQVLIPDLIRAARAGWESIAEQIGLTAAFDPNDPILVEQISRTRNLLVNIDNEVYDLVIRAIADGVDTGETVEQIAARVDNILSVTGSQNWPARAQVIARTEVTRFAEAGGMAAAQRWSANTGRRLLKKWVTRHDSRVRQVHEDVNNVQIPLRSLFEVGVSRLRYPGDPTGAPHDVINCVPGSAVISASRIQAAMRFQWDGPVLTLRGKKGFIGTVSPNHPVLTEQGWIKACDLKQGDNFLCTSGLDTELRSQPHPDGSPSSAEEVFSLLALSGVSHRVIPLAVDFHGDIPNSEVEVVFVDRELGVGVDSKVVQHFDEFCLSCPDLPGSKSGSFDEFGMASTDASGGFMGSSGLMSSLFGSHPTPLKFFGSALGAQFDSRFGNSGSQNIATESGLPAELQDGGSAQVVVDEIIEIVWDDFSGHLYTFQTASGIYIADNIVTHNCRCGLKYTEAQRGN